MANTFSVDPSNDMIKGQQYTDEQRKTVVQKLHLQGVILVHILSTFDDEWLSNCRPVVKCLLKVWNSQQRMHALRNEEKLSLGI